ncbi:XtrA/YqaO family protein [Viridibacillus arvi]|uniref:XtrA/YqaO family protein n=1 Tax=Viridibacillus arvi TaxID=263475 RepID=UPI0034CEC4C3
MSSERIRELTDTSTTINDLIEKGKVKIILLDGVKHSNKSIELPEHGDTIVHTQKSKGHKVKFNEEYLI